MREQPGRRVHQNNMASTGCGKTPANARIMNALADRSKACRCAFALGLRRSRCKRARLSVTCWVCRTPELAIKVGGAAASC